MATNLDILIRARDDASGTIRKVEGSARSFGSTLKRMAGYVGIAFATTEVIRFGKEAVVAFDEIEHSRQRLEFGLEKLGASKGLPTITKQLRDFSLQTGLTQQDLTDTAGKVTNLGGKFLKTLGKDAPQAVVNLTKALADAKAAGAKFRETMIPALVNTPEKATGQLQRLGVLTLSQVNYVKALAATTQGALLPMIKSHAITRAQANEIRKLTDAQRRQKATQIEVTALGKKWNGAAKAAATWLDVLRARWDDIKLTVGRLLEGAGSAVVKWFQQNVGLVKDLMAVLGALAVGWGVYTLAVNAASIAQTIMLKGMYLLDAVMAINPWVLLAAAIVVAAVLIIRHWTAVKQFLISTWHNIVKVAVTVWHALYKALSFTPIMIMFRLEWAYIKLLFKAAFAAIGVIVRAGATVWRNVISPAIHAVASVIKTVLGAIKSAWNTVWGGLSGPVKTVFGAIIGFVKTGINGIIHAFNGLIHAYNIIPGHTDIPTIPTLDKGGMVKETGLAVVHRGERFSGTRGEYPIGGAGGDTYHFHNNARPWQEDDLIRVLKRAQMLRGGVRG